MSDLLTWELPLPVNIRISGQKSTYNTLKDITIRHYPVKNTNRYGIRYPEHIFLLPVKSHDQFLCLVVLLASPSSSGILHPIPTKNKDYFPTFLYESHYEHHLQSWSVITSVSSPDKLIMKVYDDYEDPPVWANLDPLSHLMKLVKLLITILSNIFLEPLNKEKK